MFCLLRTALAVRRAKPVVRAATALTLLILLGALPGIAEAQPAPGIITTIAGTGVNGYSGDGGAGTAAQLSYPYGAALDASGNVYIADFQNHRVRRVDHVTGVIATVAGTGAPGFSGDGGPASEALLNYPIGVAVDRTGNLFISDHYNHRVRRVDATTGTITTYVGTGDAGYNGDGVAATAAQLYFPWGLALDAAGNLYIADLSNSRVRLVNAATGLVTTVAGNGSYVFSGDGGAATESALAPIGVALDAEGNLYVADYSNSRIRVVHAGTGIISTVAGNGNVAFAGDGGPATAASLNYPYSVGISKQGDLYIADTNNHRIRMVTAATGVITTVAGTGSPGYNADGIAATAAQLYYPIDVDLYGGYPLDEGPDPGGDLVIVDHGNYRIRKVTFLASPAITWANPAGIVYGTALSATQLNATTTVAGTFVYDPPAGTVLQYGAGQILSVTFTPDDLVTYAPATATVTIDVARYVPVVTWPAPAPIPAGTALSATQLNATTTVDANFVYTPPAGTVLSAGAGQVLAVRVIPEDSLNYAIVDAQVTIDVTGGPVNGPPYTLTVTPAPGGKIQGAGINCGAGGAACAVTMPASMTLGLSATASAGYTFTNWTGDCTGTTTSQWLSLAGPRACSAVFTPVAAVYTLTIAPVPAGGTVTGGGLTCGAGGSTCAVTFGSATTATLTAAAAAGYTFAGWGGACSGTAAGTTVQVDAATTCTATFTASGGGATGPPYTLTVTPPTGGKVQGAGINCGAGGTACAVTMPAAMTLGLSATASAGYTFTAWTGDCTGTTAAKWLSLNGPRTCGATFTATGGGGGGTPAGGIITTLAGNGTYGFGGDGGAATAAALSNPVYVASDRAGNIFVSDPDNDRVRRVDAASGIITTVAGTGVSGFSGDGGPATEARLNTPAGLAVDGAGNLYIADYSNFRIRMVAAGTGIITTLAGTGTSGSTGDGGPATGAQLASPYALAADAAGNMFIGLLGEARVRRVDAVTGVITTVAGTGTFGFSGDGGLATAAEMNGLYGLAFDGSGNLFVADLYNNRVRRVDATTGIITTVAGTGTMGFSGDGGPATAAALDYPLGLALDGAGNLFVADYNNQRVRMVAAATGVITTMAGAGTAGFSGDGGPATEAAVNYPYGLAVDPAGNLYIADSNNSRVRKVGSGSVAPPADGPPYTLTVTPPTGGTDPGRRDQLRRGRHGVRGDDARADDARAGRDAQRGLHVRRVDGRLQRGIAVAVAQPEGRAHLQRDVHGERAAIERWRGPAETTGARSLPGAGRNRAPIRVSGRSDARPRSVHERARACTNLRDSALDFAWSAAENSRQQSRRRSPPFFRSSRAPAATPPSCARPCVEVADVLLDSSCRRSATAHARGLGHHSTGAAPDRRAAGDRRGAVRDHLDRGWYGRGWLLGRRRTGDRRGAPKPLSGRGGPGGKPLHRRLLQSRDQEGDRGDGCDHHGGGDGDVWLKRRQRARDGSGAEGADLRRARRGW